MTLFVWLKFLLPARNLGLFLIIIRVFPYLQYLCIIYASIFYGAYSTYAELYPKQVDILICKADKIHIRSATVKKKGSPMIPPWPGPVKNSFHKGFSSNASPVRGCNGVCKATTNLWGRLFDEGYKADVAIHTDDGGIVYAHANLLVSLTLIRYHKCSCL